MIKYFFCEDDGATLHSVGKYHTENPPKLFILGFFCGTFSMRLNVVSARSVAAAYLELNRYSVCYYVNNKKRKN